MSKRAEELKVGQQNDDDFVNEMIDPTYILPEHYEQAMQWDGCEWPEMDTDIGELIGSLFIE